jgi:hypothetical protein
MFGKLLTVPRAYPAMSYVTALGVIVSLITAFARLGHTQAAFLATIATATGTLITAFRARPVSLAVIGGAAGSLLQGLALFGLRLPPAQNAAVVAGVSLVLGFVLHLLLVPVTARPLNAARKT